MKRLLQLGLLSSVISALFTPGEAQAFCGFYVSGADASLYANASLVVMMREGTQTVRSLQNSYQVPIQKPETQGSPILMNASRLEVPTLSG